MDLLTAAHAALREATTGLTSDQLTAPTPCAEWTVAQVVEHAVLDQGIWATAVGGAPPVSGDAFAPSGAPVDVDGALTRAAAAWAGAPAEVDSPLPQGRLDLATAERMAALDAAVHAWDVAVAVGAGPVLDDELAAEILPAARELVEPLRAWGAYAAALEPAGPPAAQLLRYLGRDPEWTAR